MRGQWRSGGSRKGYDHWAASIFLSTWEGTREGLTDGTFSREGGIYRAVFSQGGRSPPSLGTVRSEQRAGSLRFRIEKRILAEHHPSGAAAHCRDR